VKRVFDATAATLGLVMMSPVIAVAGAIVKLNSPGPAIYRGERIGRNGKPFHIYKLRTMRMNARASGLGITGAKDPRVTAVGRFLRRTKLDELPQLLNVVLGEMSLVGPRPEAPEYVRLYTDEQREVLAARPGMTGLAVISYLDEEAILGQVDPEAKYLTSVMPKKLALDLQYVRNASFGLDMKIIGRTLWLLVRRPARGVSPEA
jgi:lipopolysaccharide/colanic/teichoic acid biosynthesis glycosyltransferase